jgi:hypothetical protein
MWVSSLLLAGVPRSRGCPRFRLRVQRSCAWVSSRHPSSRRPRGRPSGCPVADLRVGVHGLATSCGCPPGLAGGLAGHPHRAGLGVRRPARPRGCPRFGPTVWPPAGCPRFRFRAPRRCPSVILGVQRREPRVGVQPSGVQPSGPRGCPVVRTAWVSSRREPPAAGSPPVGPSAPGRGVGGRPVHRPGPRSCSEGVRRWQRRAQRARVQLSTILRKSVTITGSWSAIAGCTATCGAFVRVRAGCPRMRLRSGLEPPP